MNHKVPVYQRHDNEPLLRNSAETHCNDPDQNTTSAAYRGQRRGAYQLGLPISLHVGMAGTSGAIIALQRSGLLGADVN
jgi:hypothetical protein